MAKYLFKEVRHLGKNESIYSEIETGGKQISLAVYSFQSLSVVGNHGHAQELSGVLLVEALTPVLNKRGIC